MQNMKSLFSKILILAATSVLLWSCEKDETRAVLKSGAAPTLATNRTTPLVLTQANASQTAVEFTWGAVDYGYSDAIQYVLQIARSGTNFAGASATEVAVSKAALKKGFTVAELNAELNKIVASGVPSDVDVRLKADAAGIVSNTVKLTVTPYRVLVMYSWPSAINLAGNFQGWAPATGPQIVSLANDGNYAGFVDFSTGTPAPEFKFVKGNDWSAGDFGSAGTGLLGNGGGNLQLSAPGIYLIRANTTARTWTNDRINGWGIIGSATAGGWNSDQDLTWNAASKTYTITTNLSAGELKFRANDDWAINLGDNKGPGVDGKPELGGDNIAIATAGNYTITLDIMIGGNWVYVIKKN